VLLPNLGLVIIGFAPTFSGRLKWLFIFAKRGSFQKDATRLAGARFRHGGLLQTAD